MECEFRFIDKINRPPVPAFWSLYENFRRHKKVGRKRAAVVERIERAVVIEHLSKTHNILPRTTMLRQADSDISRKILPKVPNPCVAPRMQQFHRLQFLQRADWRILLERQWRRFAGRFHYDNRLPAFIVKWRLAPIWHFKPRVITLAVIDVAVKNRSSLDLPALSRFNPADASVSQLIFQLH